MKKVQWTPSIEFLAQAGHCLLGALAVVCAVLFVHRPPNPTDAIWGGIVILVGYMLPKEFIFDILVEGDDNDMGWRDFGWMTIGVLGANAAVWFLIK
jgi:hypothetical protein